MTSWKVNTFASSNKKLNEDEKDFEMDIADNAIGNDCGRWHRSVDALWQQDEQP